MWKVLVLVCCTACVVRSAIDPSDADSLPSWFNETHPDVYFDSRPYWSSEKHKFVELLIDGIHQELLRHTVSKMADFFTRNSLAKETLDAAEYMLEETRRYGCEDAHLMYYKPMGMEGYAPNVRCYVYGENRSDIVVVGGHYDDRAGTSTNTTSRAPGADDNASGAAGVLSVLRSLTELRGKHKLKHQKTVLFAWFSGEEQGLLGSYEMAKELLADSTVTISAMVGLDMLAWPTPTSPKTLYWLENRVTKELTDLGVHLSKLYIQKDVQLSPACCSDQSSFIQVGIPATSVVESTKYAWNPNYHKSSDLPDTLDYPHLTLTIKAAASLIGTLIKD